jgi:hypothetical protein
MTITNSYSRRNDKDGKRMDHCTVELIQLELGTGKPDLKILYLSFIH